MTTTINEQPRRTEVGEHTPTPWYAKAENNYVPAQVWYEGMQIAEVYGDSREQRAANVALIVRAVNNFAGLVAALVGRLSLHRSTTRKVSKAGAGSMRTTTSGAP